MIVAKSVPVVVKARKRRVWLEDALLELGPGERVSATGIPWSVYTRLADFRNEHRSGVRITFDRGSIEIMSPQYRHEKPNFRLSMLVIALAEELGIEFVNIGSTTLRCVDAAQGLESDVCFYIGHARSVIGVKDIDLAVHPAPDLAIEVDNTSSSVDKEPIYHGMEVPEIWRHDDEEVVVRHRADNGVYITAECSLSFPKVTAADLTKVLDSTNDDGDAAFLRQSRVWAKQMLAR